MDNTFDSLEIPSRANLAELRENAEAACRTMELAEKHDLPLDEDLYLNLPPPANSQNSTRLPVSKSSASLLIIYDMLREYGASLNATVEEVRNTIINKLLLETESQDPNVRLKALKMLGEVPEIGLFSPHKAPKSADTVDPDVSERLKAKLHELKKSAEGVYETKEGE